MSPFNGTQSAMYLDLVGGLVLVLERAVLVAGAVHAHDGDGLLLQTLQLGGGGHGDQGGDDQLERVRSGQVIIAQRAGK